MTGSACRDIIKTFQYTFRDSASIQNLNYEEIWKSVETLSGTVIEKHFCSECNTIFPDDKDMFHCATTNCDRLRYKGSIKQQTLGGRQPRNFFVITDIKTQLKLLLESPGMNYCISLFEKDTFHFPPYLP
jgi:hypothetical protein